MIPINYQELSVLLKNSKNSRKFCFEMINTCPFCHTSMHFKPSSGIASVYNNLDIIGLPLSCSSCGKIFISVYQAFDSYSKIYDGAFGTSLMYTGPSELTLHIFEEEIQSVSPSFCKLYHEAQTAEYHELEDLAGMGYRKALEYLIKDFAIHTHPSDEEQIKIIPLMQCINTYVDDANIRATASRCAWIGNDYAHYIRKFDDRDVHDIKRFLKATVHWISMRLITEEALQLSPR